jgi:peptide-methionine (S)-S-oxide reductase
MNGCGTQDVPMANEQQNTDSDNQTTQSPPAATAASATFAGGCFWGVEYNFRRVPGVVDAAAGYMGGAVDDPSYQQVCDEDTGHAEVVHLTYDPENVTYEQLVRIFFLMHDPTTLNRQGPDVGEQYRSAIFYHSPEQKETAQKVKAELDASGTFKRPIVTEITQADTFWKAEEYHQNYIAKNPLRRCHVVDFDEVRKILSEK